MPYIEGKQRARLADALDGLLSVVDEKNAGELNYILTEICIAFIGLDMRYARINETVGALECCKLELYRRLAAPYEDTCIERNGDVY